MISATVTEVYPQARLFSTDPWSFLDSDSLYFNQYIFKILLILHHLFFIFSHHFSFSFFSSSFDSPSVILHRTPEGSWTQFWPVIFILLIPIKCWNKILHITWLLLLSEFTLSSVDEEPFCPRYSIYTLTRTLLEISCEPCWTYSSWCCESYSFIRSFIQDWLQYAASCLRLF